MGSGWPVGQEAKLGRSSPSGAPRKIRTAAGYSPPLLCPQGEEKNRRGQAKWGQKAFLLWTPLLKTKTSSTPDKAKAVPAKSARGHQHISLKPAYNDVHIRSFQTFFLPFTFPVSVSSFPKAEPNFRIFSLSSLKFLPEALLSPYLFCPCPSPLSDSTCCFQEESTMERRGRETEKRVCTLRRGECLV